MSPGKRALILALVVLGVLAVLVPTWMYVSGPRTALDQIAMVMWPRSFSPDAWASHSTQRHVMADDLASSGLLRGKSDAWLERNLGRPGRAFPDDFRPDEYDYVREWLAPSPMRPDDRLVIWSRQGVVVGFSLTPDPETGPELP